MDTKILTRWLTRPLWRVDRDHRPAPGRDAQEHAVGGGWRSFLLALLALGAALFLALYSGAAADGGHLGLAGMSALAALGLAGWVALTIVPVLARRTPLAWLSYQIDYKVTREGVIYLGFIFVVALAALNTGNNLLFMILGCLIAGVLVSGIFSRLVLGGTELHLELPEHIFAGRPVLAIAELHNHKYRMPSFSIAVVGEENNKSQEGTGDAKSRILTQSVYFPYVHRHSTARQTVEMTFPRRGLYHQDFLGLRTKFPFGFLEKTRRLNSGIEALVYPAVEPTEEFYEILPLVSGELESDQRGCGHDLYRIRDYQVNESARHLDWKASARSAVLQVREYAREDERQLMLVFDPYDAPAPQDGPGENAAAASVKFERAVTLCAALAWHFYEMNSVLEFRCAGFATPRTQATEIVYDILRSLARVVPLKPQPGKNFIDTLGDAADIFKIVFTSQPRGSIPTGLWSSSYFLFVPSLESGAGAINGQPRGAAAQQR